MKAHKITLLGSRRFLSQHLGATLCYDRKHMVIKVRLSGGGYGELVRERQGDETYRDQMCVIDVPGWDPVILECA
jgi:hypothetical protein